MITFLRIVLALLVIVLITFQTPIENYNTLLQVVHDSNIFATYGEAKQFLRRFTVVTIILFIFINIIS